jgi:hypothetical protein
VRAVEPLVGSWWFELLLSLVAELFEVLNLIFDVDEGLEVDREGVRSV